MEVKITEFTTGSDINVIIETANRKDMPARKNGWQFTWRTLYKTEGATFYKLSLKDSGEVQGMLMLSVMAEEMLYMNNIEVAPHNFGSKGKYENVAGCLIAYACLKSFELGQNNYTGYLTFDSKTKLIPFYEQKYSATWTMGQKMYIAPNIGLKHIEKYLNRKMNDLGLFEPINL